jgi:hypothetical protein
MAGGCFTDVVLHNSKNYHQEHATEPCRLPKDIVAAWGAVTLRFHGFANLHCSNLCPQFRAFGGHILSVSKFEGKVQTQVVAISFLGLWNLL